MEEVQKWMDLSKKRNTAFQTITIMALSAFALPTFGAPITIPLAIGSILANTWHIWSS